jgi:predicted P-loop ATPase/GTPase
MHKLITNTTQTGGKSMRKEIEVKFKGRTDWIVYTTDILELLKTDPQLEYITDKETGELLFPED